MNDLVSMRLIFFFYLSEIARHNTRTDCWLIIDRTVYDVTPYVEDHPGKESNFRS